MNQLILAQAAQPGTAASLLNMVVIPFALMFFVIYFFMIRPQAKKQKEHQAMLDSLQINDKVITSSGIIGVIVNIKSDKNIIVVRVDDTTGTRIEFQKSSIVGKVSNE